MSLTITNEAAEFLLRRMSPGASTLRLTTQQKPGCGDIAHKFDHIARKTDNDTVTVMHGLTVLCNFREHPEYLGASIELARPLPGMLQFEKIVVIPAGATLCGCGETARLPEKT